MGGDKSGVGQRRFYKQLIAKADALYDGPFGRDSEKEGQLIWQRIHLTSLREADYDEPDTRPCRQACQGIARRACLLSECEK